MMMRRTISRCWLMPLALALLLGGLVLPAPAAYAATTRHVTDCGDAGANTLRGQIAAAAAGDTIVFDRDCVGATAITLATGTLTLARNVTIDGTGHTVVVDGGCTLTNGTCSSGGVTVFHVNNGVTAKLTALTIQHGNVLISGGGGGGIYTLYGALTVTNCIVSGNSASIGLGGGIFSAFGPLTVTNSTLSGNTDSSNYGGGIFSSHGPLTVTNSVFTGNSALSGGGIANDSGGTATVTNSTFTGNSASSGGGIQNEHGTLTVTTSTLSGNTVSSYGGGIDNDVGSTLTVTTSTLSGNSATDRGGGIRSDGPATVTNSTITGNSAGLAGGGGVYADQPLTVTNSTISGNSGTNTGGGIGGPGGVTVTNTIVAGNMATTRYPDVSGRITSHGHNLFGNTSGGIGYVASDLQNVNPLLGTFGNNGGPTQTVPLLHGSPAINAGNDAVCAAAPVSRVDQRGVVRPVATCAIGAYEPQTIAALPLPAQPGPAGRTGNPLPAVRPAGSSGGVPNLLPMPRP